MNAWVRPVLVSAFLVLSTAWPAAAVMSGAPTVGPDRTAWYDASYPTTTPSPPPPPPGVGAQELLVQGATLTSSLLPVAPPTAVPDASATGALAAMLFTVPNGSTPATLTLKLSGSASSATVEGKAPTGVSPEACPAAASFTAGGRQAFDRAPVYDCTGRTSHGALSSDGSAVVFSDIAGIAKGKVLSFIIRPGSVGADRLVFAPPTASALSLLAFDSAPTYSPQGTPLPPASSSVPPSASSGSTAAPDGSSPGGLTGPPGLGQGTAAAPTMGGGDSPAVAPPVQSAPQGTPSRVVQAALDLPDDSLSRAAALAGLALLIAYVAFLTATDEGGRALSTWRALQLLRAGELPPAAAPVEWGVGAHRAPRAGTVARVS